MEHFDHLKIRMEDIISATGNFSHDRLIGRGGFGPVYKGELSLSTPTMVAFKRLDRRLGQGNTEFWKEITMLSELKHANLVSLMHFCIQGDERVLVYEYASRGSLDRYISDVSLTWTQRLDICLQAARALRYLHDPKKPQGRVLHRDIKSSNILLDDKWTPKVSDFRLSKIGVSNQPHTVVVSNPVGTVGYCDPLYWEMGFLSKESDVYSFGVVLFEVMCGSLCTEYRNDKHTSLVSWWKKCCDEKKLDGIIFQHIKEEIEWDSLITFSTIANQCTSRERKERPTMEEIVEELQIAHEQQNINSNVPLIEMSERAVPPLSYTSQKELISLLSKGILVDEGKRWVTINKNKQFHEMISAAECIHGGRFICRSDDYSRFSNIFISFSSDFKVEVRTRFLSPHVAYTINLVFKHEINKHGIYVPFLYKLEEETHYSKSHAVQLRKDGWLMAELYRFTSYREEHEFKIEFLQFAITSRWRHLEGIEFRPVEHYTWRSKGQTYEAKIWFGHRWTTKKDLYFLLRKGFLIHEGEKWISISKNMKKRLMISARSILIERDWIWKSQPESRFEVVAESLDNHKLTIDFQIKSESLTLETSYSCHLIYRLPEQYSLLEDYITFRSTGSINYVQSFYLVHAPPSPIIRSIADEKYDLPSHSRKIKGYPKMRKDGWMDLTLCEVSTKDTEVIKMRLECRGSKVTQFVGLVIQGIEFKPL
ncbi:unnamed protein product [Lactuca virosa]|uniref:Protein kinase domain-containing protein n=1 Tax=Lactuca virosa TaxID=75947 RepID=A0AAU9P056_9ASTR|nr:unnamed protein product [Lactuca virosa]